jgi:hypothetical protein
LILIFCFQQYGHSWAPLPEKVVELYDQIFKKELELDWKCPVRRNPTEEVKKEVLAPEKNPKM